MTSPAPLTVFLAKLIGLVMLLFGAAINLQKTGMAVTLMTMIQYRPLLIVIALICITAGLAIVLSHNIWSNVPAVVVTLYGWILLIKGAVLLLLPYERMQEMITWLHIEQRFSFYAAVPLILGCYLTWAGFTHRNAAKKK